MSASGAALTVSDTAYAIAAARAEERSRPPEARLFEDPFAEIFARAGAHAAEGTRRFLELPFFRDGIRLRTRAIDDFVREGLGAGVRQVVLMGAGFDARALRMPEISASHARVWEVDFAAQLEHKRALLAAAGAPLPAHVAHVACDFTSERFEEELASGLEASGFSRAEAALFVWEGVIAYIGRAAIDRSLRFMATAAGPGSRLVFDFSVFNFDPEPAKEVVLAGGFARFEDVGYEELWRRHLPGEPHPSASVCRIGTAYT